MSDILYYYSGSANKLVGKGANERVRDYSVYAELEKIPDWRRVLSNFYVCLFLYNERWYRSAEHAIQGAKISIADPVKGSYFSLDSFHEISTSTPDVARKNRKLVILSREQLQEYENSSIIEDILYAKFSQDELCRKTLLSTMDAELWHGVPRIPMSRQYDLERVRYRLRHE